MGHDSSHALQWGNHPQGRTVAIHGLAEYAPDRTPGGSRPVSFLVSSLVRVHSAPTRDAECRSRSEERQSLTAKEIGLLQLLADGHSNKSLGDRLCVSPSTVRTHLRNIYSKLGANNRTQAVALAHRLGMIQAQVRAGATVLQGDSSFDRYLRSLRTEPAHIASLQRATSPQGDIQPLTKKEVRLLRLLAEGHSNKALADKVFVSQSTVRTHLRNIYAKLGANNRTQTVALGRQYGLIF